MDIQQIIAIGAQAFMQKSGSNADEGTVVSALTGLLGGSDGLDIGDLISKFQGGGMADLVSSWLGDGSNQSIAPSQVVDMLGGDKVSAFASQLGMSPDQAAGGLADAIPQMIDKASSGGALLDSLGGIGGVMDMAGKLFGR
jgi:uncharacterized protein YidB (DUF937 family)